MKILLITPSYFPIIGGSEVLTHVLAKKLNKIGIKADIMTFNMNKKWKPVWKAKTINEGTFTVYKMPAFNPFPDIFNPFNNLFRINVIPSLSFVKKLESYDIIHFIGEADLSFLISSCFIKKPKIIQFVALFENGGIYKYYVFTRPFMGKIFAEYLSRLSTAYIVYSEENKKLLTRLGVTSEKILTLPLGVDTQTFHPNNKEKTDNLLLFVGRLDRIKGLHILINALHYLNFPVKLAVIGPRFDERYVSEIEQTIHEINKEGVHEVKLLGEVDHHELVSWYQKSTVVVCPYLYETFSTVTLEALSCGTPVVSTGAHISNKRSDGITIAPKDSRKLADAINKLLENRKLREKDGRDGRLIIERFFSWDVIVKSLEKIYRGLLEINNSQSDVECL